MWRTDARYVPVTPTKKVHELQVTSCRKKESSSVADGAYKRERKCDENDTLNRVDCMLHETVYCFTNNSPNNSH